MLKYIILCSIVVISYSDRTSVVYDYNALLFIQVPPTTAYISLENQLKRVFMSPDEISSYMNEHAGPLVSLDPKSWIVRELIPLDENGHYMSFCKDPAGNPLKYVDNVPNNTIISKLRKKWPSYLRGIEHNQYWQESYDMDGSCIDSDPSEFFELGLQMLNTYNVGELLRRTGIFPGERYRVGRVFDALKYILGVDPYLKCYKNENQEYFLHQVRICFNKTHYLHSCVFRQVHDCGSTTITYPKWLE